MVSSLLRIIPFITLILPCQSQEQIDCLSVIQSADLDNDGFINYSEYQYEILSQMSPYEGCPPARTFGVILPSIFRDFHGELCRMCTVFDTNPNCCNEDDPRWAVPGTKYGELYEEQVCVDFKSLIDQECNKPPTAAPVFLFPEQSAPTASPAQTSTTLAPTSQSGTPIDQESPTGSGNDDPDIQPRSSSSSSNNTVAIVVPIVIAILLCLLCTFFIRRKRKDDRDPATVFKTGSKRAIPTSPEVPEHTYVDGSDFDDQEVLMEGGVRSTAAMDFGSIQEKTGDDSSMDHDRNLRELLDTLEAQNSKQWYEDSPSEAVDSYRSKDTSQVVAEEAHKTDASTSIEEIMNADSAENLFMDDCSSEGSETKGSSTLGTGGWVEFSRSADPESQEEEKPEAPDHTSSSSGTEDADISGSGEWEAVFVGGQIYSTTSSEIAEPMPVSGSEDERGWSDEDEASSDEDIRFPQTLIGRPVTPVRKVIHRNRSLTPPPMDRSIPEIEDKLHLTPEAAEPDDSDDVSAEWGLQKHEGGVYMV